MITILDDPNKILVPGHVSVPKKLMKDMDRVEKAIYLSLLVNEYAKENFKEFYLTIPEVMETTNISRYLLVRFKKELIQEGFILKTELRDRPTKEYFFMNKSKIKKYWKI